MGFIERNINPDGKMTDDCVIRALAAVMGYSWEKVYADLSVEGMNNHDLWNKNYVWMNYLRKKGFSRAVIPNTCPDCYTIADFAKDHPIGKYIVGTGTHVVAVIDGDYIDTWDSGREVPIFFLWRD